MFTVVIITRNEAHIIEKVLQSLSGLTDEIIVVDSNSTDGTPEICERFGAKVIKNEWRGYGHAKNKGILSAKYDWILSLDADEVPDESLRKFLLNLDLSNNTIVYRVKLINFFCGRMIRFGVWGADWHIRLFNRESVEWSNDEVHEKLIFKSLVQVVSLKGRISHYTAEDVEVFREKMKKYAKLNAEKYFRMGRRSGWLKIYFSPIFGFINHFVFKLGFLDGWPGLRVCLLQARYTYDKYFLLNKLYKSNRASF